MNRITSTTADDRMSRRQFLKVLGLSAAGLGLLEACAASTTPNTGSDTLETTTIRLVTGSISVCNAPLYLAGEFLKQDGFTNVLLSKNVYGDLTVDHLVSGQADLAMQFSGPSLLYLDAGKPITVVAGIHVGCFELFGSEQVNEISDLKGKTIAIGVLGGPDHVYLASILAYVGLDPNVDVNWITRPAAVAQQLFTDGKVDAFLAFPPTAQELRAKKIGHVVVNSMMDTPWSQYFCCMATFSRDFAQNKPVATKRALRALLKATDVCALDPKRAARLMVDEKVAANYDYALEALQDIPYNHWRAFNPEDTLRFYALRLREAKMIKSDPAEVIAQGSDWRFINEIKAEMKG